MGRLAIVLLLPFAARAQLALFTYDGTTETPAGSIYDYGKVAAGTAKDARFRARNFGNSAVVLTTLTVSGAGFSIPAAPTGSSTIAPGNFLQFTVHFSAALPAAYSANLQVNGISVFLLAKAVPAPTLTIFPVCTAPNAIIDFGVVPIGSLRLCNFSVVNPYSQPLTVSSISVTGAFQLVNLPQLPVIVTPGAATTFMIQLTPVCGTTNYSGTLIVDSQTFPLTATGSVPPLPKPVLTFDASTFASGEQHTLTLTLPSPYPCAATGTVTLAFASLASVVSDDSAIVFVARNARTAPFVVNPNSTQVVIGGQSGVVFQTGTTQGRITFSVGANGLLINGDPTTSVTIPAAPISIDTATASNRRLGNLDVEVIGVDNTYTAGNMSFTFFDASGNAIGSSVSPDFTSAFKTYFTSQQSGSAFLMRVSFPIVGSQTQVAGMELTMTNAAGQAKTARLKFQ